MSNTKMEKSDPNINPIIKSALEYDVAQETREFLKSRKHSEIQKKSPKTLPFYLSGIAASIVILFLSILSIQYTYSNQALADQYQIKNFQERDASNEQLDVLRSAYVSYNQKSYKSALELINPLLDGEGDLKEHAEWLQVLCSLKMDTPDEIGINSILENILGNSNHLYAEDAKKLSKALAFPLRTLIVK